MPINVPKPITSPTPFSVTHTPYNPAAAAQNAFNQQFYSKGQGQAPLPVGTITGMYPSMASVPKPSPIQPSIPTWWNKVASVMSTPSYKAQEQRGTAPSIGNILAHSSLNPNNMPAGYTMLGKLSGPERYQALGLSPQETAQAQKDDYKMAVTAQLQKAPEEVKQQLAKQLPEELIWQILGQNYIPVSAGGKMTAPVPPPTPVAPQGPVQFVNNTAGVPSAPAPLTPSQTKEVFPGWTQSKLAETEGKTAPGGGYWSGRTNQWYGPPPPPDWKP